MLDGIQARYDAELKTIFGRLPTRGMIDHREAWEAYLAFVRREVPTDALIKAHAAELELLAKGGRGGALPWRDDKDQVTGLRFPEKSVLLTFDDGPSARYTPVILDILGASACAVCSSRSAATSARPPRRRAGCWRRGRRWRPLVHPRFLPKLDADGVNHQLADTNQALAAGQREDGVVSPAVRRAQRAGSEDGVGPGDEDRAVERRFAGLGGSGAVIDRQSRDQSGREAEARDHPLSRHSRAHHLCTATGDRGAAKARTRSWPGRSRLRRAARRSGGEGGGGCRDGWAERLAGGAADRVRSTARAGRWSSASTLTRTGRACRTR